MVNAIPKRKIGDRIFIPVSYFNGISFIKKVDDTSMKNSIHYFTEKEIPELHLYGRKLWRRVLRGRPRSKERWRKQVPSYTT